MSNPPHEQFTALDVRPDMDQSPWSDVDRRTIRHGQVERIGLLRNGTEQGRASIAILVRLADGTVAVGETTWRLFHAAARALAVSPAAREEV